MHFMNHHRKDWEKNNIAIIICWRSSRHDKMLYDGMVIVLNGDKPYIFLEMTCNPSWSEITSKLLPFQTTQDRPDLLTRVFRSKFEQLKDGVINEGVLEKVKSYMYVTGFQKRVLSYMHMLLVLETNNKLRDPEEYGSVVRA